MPLIPALDRASFTSSSLNGLMMASIFFMRDPASNGDAIQLKVEKCPNSQMCGSRRLPSDCAPVRVRWAAAGVCAGRRSRTAALLARFLVNPDQSHPDRVQREFDPVTDVQLLEDIVQMCLH